MKRKIICRFADQSDINNFNVHNFSYNALKFDLDSKEVLKERYEVIRKPIIDKHDCATNYVDMPEFKSKKIEAYHKAEFFFADISNEELSTIFRQNITDKTKTIWYPRLVHGKNASLRVIGGSSKTKYPIYIVSKGRHDCCHTSTRLSQMHVNHFVVVEKPEVEKYVRSLNGNYATVLELGEKYKTDYDVFSDLGNTSSTGPGAARNFCWDHSIICGHKRHWVFDDNATEGFHWLYQNTKVKCRTGAFFSSIENFVDRYENIAIAGFNYSKFCKATDRLPPYVLNTRIYSFMLIDNNLNIRWRGRYNEDTDLSLRVLKSGKCTIQFNSFLAGKATTSKIGGGNTSEFYEKEGTYNKSKMLKDMHPDIVEMVWKFNRHHHFIYYGNFRQKLIPKVDLSKFEKVNNYGMKVVDTNEKDVYNDRSYLEKKYSGNDFVTLNSYETDSESCDVMSFWGI